MSIAVGYGNEHRHRICHSVGATKIHHLDDAIGALSIELSSGEIDRLEEPYQPHPLPPQLA